MSTIHELEQRIKVLETLLGRGVEHLEVDEDGYLKISDMYYNTPNEAGYILDQYGNFIHTKNDSYGSWNIMSYDGTPKLVVPFEGNVRNKIGAGLEVIHSLIDAKQSNNGVSQSTGNTTLALRDKNELITNTVRSAFGTDGSIRTQLQARNYNSSGTLVKTGSLGVVVAKDGTLSYEVTEPDKFRQAIDVNALIQVKHITLGSQTVAANAVKNLNITPIVNANTPAGYTFRGIVGFSTNNGSAVMVSCRPTNSQYSFEYKNTSNAKITNTPEVFALFVKSSN